MQRGVVIVSAPAGSGKSHLVAEWCARHQRVPIEVAWVALDRADRDPARFLRYVTAAIGATPAGQDAMDAIAPLPPLTPPDEHYKLAVADAMTHLRGDVVLVLDGFDELVGSESEHLLASVLRFAVDRVRLIVLTRIDPQLGQARLRVADRLLEIGAADLAFTSEEIAELLQSGGASLIRRSARHRYALCLPLTDRGCRTRRRRRVLGRCELTVTVRGR